MTTKLELHQKSGGEVKKITLLSLPDEPGRYETADGPVLLSFETVKHASGESKIVKLTLRETKHLRYDLRRHELGIAVNSAGIGRQSLRKDSELVVSTERRRTSLGWADRYSKDGQYFYR